jgi:integrase
MESLCRIESPTEFFVLEFKLMAEDLPRQSQRAARPDAYLFPSHAVGFNGDDRQPHAYGFDLKRPMGEWKKPGSMPAAVPGSDLDCRHTFISRLCEGPNIAEETIRALAGHVSRKMMERYSHIRAAAREAAIAALETRNRF